MKKKTIMTNNREIYEKFNLLNFSPEVILKDVNKMQMGKILNNINKNGDVLSTEKIGQYTVVKRKTPVNFSVYYNKKRK